MRDKVALVLVGLLCGVLLATVVPVGASGNHAKLRKRISALENATHRIDRRTGIYMGPIVKLTPLSGPCPVGTTATWEDYPDYPFGYHVRKLDCAP